MTIHKTLWAAAAVIALASFPSWADVAEGVAAYSRGDYATALAELETAADQGDAVAQFNLGLIYYYGHGVPQDYLQAVAWYRKAADQGHAGAQYALVTCRDF
jgi:TPR repeat protein